MVILSHYLAKFSEPGEGLVAAVNMTVIGRGTQFTKSFSPGDAIMIGNGRYYQSSVVARVEADDRIELTSPLLGFSAASSSYRRIPGKVYIQTDIGLFACSPRERDFEVKMVVDDGEHVAETPLSADNEAMAAEAIRRYLFQ